MLHLFKSRVFESLIIYLLFLSLAHLKSRCTVCNRSMELVQRWSLQTFADIVLNIWTFLPIAIAHIHASWLLACIFFFCAVFRVFHVTNTHSLHLHLVHFSISFFTISIVSHSISLDFFYPSLSLFASSICQELVANDFSRFFLIF